MTANMIHLKEILELLARPGIKLEASLNEMTLRVVSRSDSSVDLLVYAIKPIVDDLTPHEQPIIQGFNVLSDLVAVMIDRTDMRTIDPLNFKQDIFNKGILMNQYGLLDALDFKLTHLETDRAKWLNA